MQQLLRDLPGQAGIDKRLHPHLLRHTFCTRALQCGMDAITVARILGHTDVRMVMRVYQHLQSADYSAAMERVFAKQAIARHGSLEAAEAALAQSVGIDQ